MDKQLVIGVDVDDVCADLLGEWLRRYNRDYDDRLTPDDIVEWDMAKQTKAGSAIFTYLRDVDLYTHVLPLSGARQAVQRLREHCRVVFITSCVMDSVDMKMRWLQRWGFLPDGQGSPKDFIAATDKALVNADILLDDHVKNVEAFPRVSFLIARPHNRLLECSRPRVGSLEQAAGWILNNLVESPYRD